MSGSPNDAVWLCADNAAGWHASWLTALGLRWERSETVWRALQAPPFIYWAAITLGPDASARQLQGSPGTVCDAGACLDLSPFGYREWTTGRPEGTDPWYVRPPGPLTALPLPAGLQIAPVSSEDEAAAFESVSLRGFGHDVAGIERFAIHPPGVLNDQRATLVLGLVDGVGVAAAMSYRTERSLGIYGVTTLPAARGRGYASAMTNALIDAELPNILSPSMEAEGLYRRLGFEEVGRLRHWVPLARVEAPASPPG